MIVAVLDTNVLVSAACLPRSLPAELLRRWLSGDYYLVVPEHVLSELDIVLARRKIRDNYDVTLKQAASFTGVLRSLATIVSNPPIVEQATRDPNDDAVVAGAATVNADYVVSGDKHLLDVKNYRGVAILSPAQFLAQLQAIGDESGR